MEKDLTAVHKELIGTLDEKAMGTLKFHNLELFLSLNAKKLDPVQVHEAIVNLRQSLSQVEENLSCMSEIAKNPREALKLVTDPEVQAAVAPSAALVAKASIKQKKYNSEIYFSAKNHQDLYNIGSFYYQEYLSGKRRFALYADNNFGDPHHSLLGLASYFNYHEDLKVTLITNNFQQSSLPRHLKNAQRELRFFQSEEFSYEVIVCGGVEVLEYSALRHICKKLGREHFESFLDDVLCRAEISFWNLPGLKTIDQEREFFFPLMRKIETTSILLTKGKSKASELKHVLNYAQKYNLKISGVLFDKGARQ